MANQLEAELNKIVSEITEIPLDKLKPDADFFDDLKIDSMKAIEIVAAFEKKYKVVIPEEEIPKMRSLSKIIAFAKDKIK
ncbi:MAG: acyl carrier protein [Candidatus Omnitrophica bacterium]|nr:acyl carrier protein [Candidatus Omnitrophota bacterium]